MKKSKMVRAVDSDVFQTDEELKDFRALLKKEDAKVKEKQDAEKKK